MPCSIGRSCQGEENPGHQPGHRPEAALIAESPREVFGGFEVPGQRLVPPTGKALSIVSRRAGRWLIATRACSTLSGASRYADAAATLEDVVRHYETHLGFLFTDDERADLVAFLNAL